MLAGSTVAWNPNGTARVRAELRQPGDIHPRNRHRRYGRAAGNTALALGNAPGWNITSAVQIPGLTALIMPLIVHCGIVKRMLPVPPAVMPFVLALLAEGALSCTDGGLPHGGIPLMLF